MTVIDITPNDGDRDSAAPDREWNYLLKAVDEIKQGMAAFDGEDRLMAWNRAFESLHDYPADFCRIGLPLRDMLTLKAERGDYADMGDDTAQYVSDRIDAMRGPDKTALEILDHKGNCVEMEISHTGDGGMVVFYKDITLRKQSEMSLWRKANFDELTGLANRNLFYDRLEQALHLARRQNKGLSVMFLDLDSFKQVNDTMGHAAGDEVLATVSRRMQSCLRQSDTAARLSGDEFAILLTENSEAPNVELVANKIIRMLATDIPLPEGNAQITASIGAAIYPDNADNADDLVAIADTAMYRAKKSGKNQFRLAEKA